MRCKGYYISILTALVVSAVTPTIAPAQIGSFGRNKPTTEMYEWKYVQTPHFDIYYYGDMENIARIATTIVEESYDQISASFDYRLRNRVPIVIYGSRTGFRETHLTPGLVPEGTGGFTEFLKNRVVVPFEGSYSSFRHVLHHELAHAVLLDMLYGKDILQGIQQSDIPLWFIEGLAEYESMPWSAESDMWMRDAVINDYLNLDGYFAYKGGQSIMYYIAEVYGPEKIPQILHRLRSTTRFHSTMQAVLGLELEDFGEAWEKDLKKVYWPEIVDREEPDDVGEALTDHTEDGSYFNRNPAFSPYGDKIAFFTGRDYYTSIYVMSAIDGKVLWKVVTGEESSSYEEMHWQRGQISWSPDAKQLAFSARSTEADRIYIVDARTGERQHTFQPDLDGVYSPAWSPDGSQIAFVGVESGLADLYVLEVVDGSISRLTHDRFNDSSPTWSPDGTKILFDSDRKPGLSDRSPDLLYQTTDIYMIDVGSGQMRRLTTNPRDDSSPTWSPDGNHISFVSDRNGVNNLFIAEIEGNAGAVERTVRPLTDILTGAFFPSWSPTGDKIAFSGFNQGGWDIYVVRNPLDNLKPEPLRPAFYMAQDRITYRSVHRHLSDESILASEPIDPTATYRIGPRMASGRPGSWDLVNNTMTDSARGGFKPRSYHSSLKVDMVTGYANYSTLGGVGGELLVTASDLMGYHNLAFTTSLYRDLRDSDYGVLYQYLRRRTDYSVYFSQTRTWYPFQQIVGDGNQIGYETGLVERRDLYGGAYASRPTSQYRRLEFGVELMQSKTAVETHTSPFITPITQSTQNQIEAMLSTIAFVHDNTLWSSFWAVRGSRWRVQLRSAPPYANTAPFGIASADWRNYMEVGENSSFAFRVSGGWSYAGEDRNAPVFYLGGLPYWINYDFADVAASTLTNDPFSQFVFPLRGTDYYQLTGRQYTLLNLEYRFPLIYFLAAGFPFQMIFNNVGGVMFLDVAKVWDVPDDISLGAQTGPLGGYGYGVRINLGAILLRMDVAWQTDLRETFGSARYYWSLGYDF
jgi:hypothetical protein